MGTLGLGNNGNGYKGMQYGFEWNTEAYCEITRTYGKETVVYYQFRTGVHSGELRVVPDGCVDLLFCCETAKPFAMVCGSVLSGKSIPFLAHAQYFGVRLTPALSMRLPRMSLRELVEIQAPLGVVLPEYRELGMQMAEQRDLAGRLRCFEQNCMPLLQMHNTAPSLADYCLNELHKTAGAVSVHELAEYAGYSERYLRTRFEDALGISPKMYGRIVRFQQSLRALMTDGPSLMEIAGRHGYYDQAHFVKEFKSFSQLTPQQMKREREGHASVGGCIAVAP